FHYITFDPNGESTVYVQLASNTKYKTIVDSIQLESDQDPGEFFKNSVGSDFPFKGLMDNTLRHTQSADVLYFAHKDFTPLKIERRNNNSWSAVMYAPEDGPFLPYNNTGIT